MDTECPVISPRRCSNNFHFDCWLRFKQTNYAKQFVFVRVQHLATHIRANKSESMAKRHLVVFTAAIPKIETGKLCCARHSNRGATTTSKSRKSLLSQISNTHMYMQDMLSHFKWDLNSAGIGFCVICVSEYFGLALMRFSLENHLQIYSALYSLQMANTVCLCLDGNSNF